MAPMSAAPDCSCGRGTYRPERSCYSGRLMAARCSGCDKVTGRCSCEYDSAANLRAALTTPSQPEPLDVDRLALILHGDDPTSGGPSELCGCNAQAQRIAAEYARLSETPR